MLSSFLFHMVIYINLILKQMFFVPFCFYLGTSLSSIGHLCIFCYVDNTRRCSTMWNNQDNNNNRNSNQCNRNHCDCDDCRRRRCDCDDCRRDHCDCRSHNCHCNCVCCFRRNRCGCMNPFLGVDWAMMEMMMNKNNNNKDKD